MRLERCLQFGSSVACTTTSTETLSQRACGDVLEQVRELASRQPIAHANRHEIVIHHRSQCLYLATEACVRVARDTPDTLYTTTNHTAINDAYDTSCTIRFVSATHESHAQTAV